MRVPKTPDGFWLITGLLAAGCGLIIVLAVFLYTSSNEDQKRCEASAETRLVIRRLLEYSRDHPPAMFASPEEMERRNENFQGMLRIVPEIDCVKGTPVEVEENPQP